MNAIEAWARAPLGDARTCRMTPPESCTQPSATEKHNGRERRPRRRDALFEVPRCHIDAGARPVVPVGAATIRLSLDDDPCPGVLLLGMSRGGERVSRSSRTRRGLRTFGRRGSEEIADVVSVDQATDVPAAADG
jgi:hypothetical protein